MNDKSHVSLEQHVCLVCGETFDTGALLMDRRLRASLARTNITGWDLCPKHQVLFDEGYVALVECDPERSGAIDGLSRIKPEDAYRTGRLAHIRQEVFAKIFSTAIEMPQAVIFVDPGVIEWLQRMQARSIH